MPSSSLPMPKPASDRAGVRINLTLTPPLVAILDRIGSVTGTGRATILREMLEESAPTFEQMARALELASQKKTDAFKVLTNALDTVSESSAQLSLDIKRTRRRAMRKKQAP